jgi:uncharacterized membrane protein YeiB
VAIAARTVLAFTAGAALAASLWLRVVRRGPLEAVLDIPWWLTGGRGRGTGGGGQVRGDDRP